MTNHIDIGKIGEQIAQEYLVNKKYEILETNWTHGHKEIDIIAKYEKQLVIVEVKCRNFSPLELPQNAVNRQKQRDLISAADAYVKKHDIDLEVRFDIVAVVLRGEKHEIDHIEDAFYPIMGKSY
jgi:putative endonuclease